MSDSDSDDAAPRTVLQQRPPKADPSLPAIFWDDLPDDDDASGQAAALRAILDDSSPEELAENAKDMGNKHLAMGVKLRKTFYVREAIQMYNRGLTGATQDRALRSVLHANRAQAESLLGNWGNALKDAQDAARLDPSNVKAYYRGAKAAMQLKRYADAERLCDEGLAADPTVHELSKFKAAGRGQACRGDPSLLARGWRVGRPQVAIGARKPTVDEGDGRVHWPLLFMYPQSMSTDSVEDCCEDDPLGAHLDEMFGPGAPPLEWDEEGAYTRPALEMYYLSNAARPLAEAKLAEVLYGGWPEGCEEEGPRDSSTAWVRIPDSATLAQLLARPDYVIPGIPLVFVVAAGTPYHQRFIEGSVPVTSPRWK